jgi:hypothetical protein
MTRAEWRRNRVIYQLIRAARSMLMRVAIRHRRVGSAIADRTPLYLWRRNLQAVAHPAADNCLCLLDAIKGF